MKTKFHILLSFFIFHLSGGAAYSAEITLLPCLGSVNVDRAAFEAQSDTIDLRAAVRQSIPALDQNLPSGSRNGYYPEDRHQRTRSWHYLRLLIAYSSEYCPSLAMLADLNNSDYIQVAREYTRPAQNVQLNSTLASSLEINLADDVVAPAGPFPITIEDSAIESFTVKGQDIINNGIADWRNRELMMAALRSFNAIQMQVSDSALGSFGNENVAIVDSVFDDVLIRDFFIRSMLLSNVTIRNSMILRFSIDPRLQGAEDFSVLIENSTLYGDRLDRYLDPDYNIQFCNVRLMLQRPDFFDEQIVSRNCPNPEYPDSGIDENYSEQQRVDSARRLMAALAEEHVYTVQMQCRLFDTIVSPDTCFSFGYLQARQPRPSGISGPGTLGGTYSANPNEGTPFSLMGTEFLDFNMDASAIQFGASNGLQLVIVNNNAPLNGWEDLIIDLTVRDRNGGVLLERSIGARESFTVQ